MTHQLRTAAAALTLAVASAATLSAQTFEYEGLTYSVNSDDSAPTCSVSGNYGLSGKVTIPSVAYCEGTAYTVTAIGSMAFAFLEGITAVEVPETVTLIGDVAFSCCEDLEEISLPSSLETIGSQSFYGCESLLSVDIPASVTLIGAVAFYNCPKLTAINVAEGNAGYLSIDGVLFDAQGVVQYPGGKTGSYSIPEQTALGKVTTIGSGAFHECQHLTEVSIPASVAIYMNPFLGCPKLTAINVAEGNTGLQSVDGVLFDSEALIAYPPGRAGAYSVPAKTDICGPVKTIRSYAFSYCDALTELTLPASLVTLESYAIEGGGNLTAINVAEGNTVLQSVDGVLFDSTGLRLCPAGKSGHYVIPEKTGICGPVATIHSRAFDACGKLTEVTIPATITQIGDPMTDYGVFNNCKGLNTLNVYAVTPPSVAANRLGFIGYNGGVLVRVPYGTLDAYSKAGGWSDEAVTLVEMTQEESALDEVRGADGETFDVYTLQGVCVKRGACQADVDALPAGLYLVGGQKRLVR